MQISEQKYYELLDDVLHEGEPELIFLPFGSAFDDMPGAWVDVANASDWRAALRDLWFPLANRLPRVHRALQERLQGIGLLRTEEVSASLIYFFGKDCSFQFRGRSPLAEKELEASQLPSDYLDFYRLHNGFTLYFSRDNGPLPSAEWLPPDYFREDAKLKIPPGEIFAQALKVVFRIGEEMLLAFDTSKSPALPFVIWRDGTVEPLADMWATVDREVGGLLEEMELTSTVNGVADLNALGQLQEATHRHDYLLQHLSDHEARSVRFGGSSFHRQAFELYLDRAWIEAKKNGGQDSNLLGSYHRALREWCASLEAGGETDADEVMAVFGLALALGDAASAHFVATMPASFWGDGSLEAHQLHILFRLYLSDWAQAEAGIGEMLGLTFDGESPPEEKAEIVTRLLESLFRKEHRAFAEWRQRVVEKLCSGPREPNARLPWRLRLAAFDAVAYRLGIAERMIAPFVNATLA
jgi:hypothetical protein